MKYIYEIHCFNRAENKESIYPVAFLNYMSAMKKAEHMRAYSNWDRVWIEPLELNEE